MPVLRRPAIPVLLLLASAACADGGANAITTEDATASKASSSAHVGAIGDAQAFALFDMAAHEMPEGLAFDKRGNLYTTYAPLGEVVRITPAGTRSVFAALAGDVPEGAPGAVGLATTPAGNVYAALASFDPATVGVYQIGRTAARPFAWRARRTSYSRTEWRPTPAGRST